MHVPFTRGFLDVQLLKCRGYKEGECSFLVLEFYIWSFPPSWTQGWGEVNILILFVYFFFKFFGEGTFQQVDWCYVLTDTVDPTPLCRDSLFAAYHCCWILTILTSVARQVLNSSDLRTWCTVDLVFNVFLYFFSFI